MTWVKVCGLTNRDDVDAAVEAGADAVGFVNVPSSPRFVTMEQAHTLADGVQAMRILLTIDLTPADAVAAIGDWGFDGIQPYGTDRLEAARAVAAAGGFVMVPFAVSSHIAGVADLLPGEIPLLDAFSEDRLGGGGVTFDWDLLDRIGRPYVLAGGLGPDNVGRAVRRLRPWGVDASSRLERAPGVKDHSKVAAFVREAQRT